MDPGDRVEHAKSVRTTVATSLVLILLAVVYYLTAAEFPREARRAPRVTAVLMIAMAVTGLVLYAPKIRSLLREGRLGEGLVGLADLSGPWARTAVGTFAFLLVLPQIGFVLSSILFLGGLSFALSPVRGSRRDFGAALISSAAFGLLAGPIVWFAFTQLLGVRLP